ncbi:hypothetical protein [Plantactinospora mayteni]|uniref:hypothetical protein n=1 Tax=Plantactinospora mayteni TaxID=566021 RepID=UPI001942657C|nr:hypothetical protein [Plantactinospora mayteni]
MKGWLDVLAGLALTAAAVGWAIRWSARPAHPVRARVTRRTGAAARSTRHPAGPA